MFLNSLSNTRVRHLSTWIEGLFGYGISVGRAEGGHISINLVEGAVLTNVVDAGYGVSQILPVLAQIWWARERNASAGGGQAAAATLAIEQPELHLHPAHQAMLADAMVGEAISNNRPRSRRVNFLVETHSETMINRLGELIAKKKIRGDEVQIVVFDADADARTTNVKSVRFDSEGYLVDWPYGFFQPA